MVDVPSGKVIPFSFDKTAPLKCISIGFTAIVDKALSAKYDKLVNDAPELIKALPWGHVFEVDQFKKPDFTALEILHFATGGKSIALRIVEWALTPFDFQVYPLESM
jgi:hypothetical protein